MHRVQQTMEDYKFSQAQEIKKKKFNYLLKAKNNISRPLEGASYSKSLQINIGLQVEKSLANPIYKSLPS